MTKNPELIQEVDLHSQDGTSPQRRAPLFLIHDGGGTTFAYHCLEPLHRSTYGIFNPRFHSGGSFEGGVRGMGRLYASMIRQTCAEADFHGKCNPDGGVDILIGGWSMGGLLSLEIAKVLTGDAEVRVIGVLMIESMCPVQLPIASAISENGGGNDYLGTLDHLVDLNRPGGKNLALSVKAMQEALRVIRDWDPPTWAGDQAEQRPRCSLFRAIDSLPTASKRVHILDIYRDDQTLGWDRYDPELFTETVNVEGNHFEMFSFQHIPGISQAIKRCCDLLETLGES
ncbi:thioesterase domain-containing protein [Aspergillus californicus]